MINLYTSHPTSSFTFYPDLPNSASGSEYQLDLSSDLDRSTYTVENLNRLNTNTPNSFSQVVVLQAYSGSGVPPYDGQYTATLKQGLETKSQWGNTHLLFGTLHRKWSNVRAFSGQAIGTDRAYVHGTNLQSIDTYTTSNENGAYTTYND